MIETVQRPNVTWHVERHGRGAPIVLLHGLGASSHSWRDLVPLLSNEHCVVTLDLPGHGRSATTQPRLSLPWVASAVSDLLGHLKVEPIAIVGHSAGAAIAMQLVLQQGPVPSSIVSFNGAFFPFQGRANPVFRRAARLMAKSRSLNGLASWLGSDYQRVDKTLRQTGSRLEPEGVEHYRALAESRAHVASALSMMANWHLEPLLRDAPRLPCSLCAVAGRGDQAVPPHQAHRIAQLVPQGEFHTMRGGHLAHEEFPEEASQFIVPRLVA